MLFCYRQVRRWPFRKQKVAPSRRAADFPLGCWTFQRVDAGGVAAVVVSVNVDELRDASLITIVVGLKVAVESFEKPGPRSMKIVR